MRQLVAVPELGLEIGAELVVDHEPRARERRQPGDDRGGERRRPVGLLDEITAALERREPDALPGHVGERDIGERAHEDRIALTERVRRRFVQRMQRSDERPAGATPVRARALRLDDVQHEVRQGARGARREAGLLERSAELVHEHRQG